MITLLKRSFAPGDYSTGISLSLLFLRIVAGVFMLTHGYGKFLMLFGDAPIRFADPLGVGPVVSLGLTVFAEVLCSLLLIAGLATRLSAIPLIVTMLVAALVVHAPDPFVRKELPLLYAAVYMVLLVAGSGKYAVDQWLAKYLKA